MRLRWLLAALISLAAAAGAQPRPPLDLRVVPVSGGAVAAILSVDQGSTALPAPPPTPGTQTDISPSAPVGAVAVLPLGKESDHKWKFGAAGTPEMQAYLDKKAMDVVVVMDDGERRTFRPRDPSRFRVGQRVTVRGGELEPAGVRKDGT